MLHDEYYIWGAGTHGKRLIELMKGDLGIKAIIDNNPAKQGTLFCEFPVVSYAEVRRHIPSTKIVIAMVMTTAVREFLSSEGLTENKDFYTLLDFIPRIYWEKNKSLAVRSINMAATTNCNMKCTGCQTYIPFAVNQKHMSAENIKTDLDLLFSHIDMTMLLNFCCGESLLNKEMSEICLYIYRKHRNHYRHLIIQTNGTIMPEKNDMRKFSESKTLFAISNYPENSKYTKELVAKCKKFNVEWYFNSGGGDRSEWFDYGNPHQVNETDLEILRERYLKCAKPGMVINNGWLYICSSQAWANVVAGKEVLMAGEAFDLRRPDTDTSRNELYKVLLRQPPEIGFLSHCMSCNSVITPLSIK